MHPFGARRPNTACAQPFASPDPVPRAGCGDGVTAAATDLYAAALQSTGPSPTGRTDPWFAQYEDGRRRSLAGALERWCSPADDVDRQLLARASGTVLDVGCGPGRLVVELARQGREALGLDISSVALRLARQAGATVIRRSVFSPVHGEGMWSTVLLADGNIGIGGAPVVLLRRCRELIAASGQILVEIEGEGVGYRTTRIRLERGTEASDWFPWAHIGADAVADAAGRAGLRVHEVWSAADRCFATLRRDTPTRGPVEERPALL
jgi:hypothetical protein